MSYTTQDHDPQASAAWRTAILRLPNVMSKTGLGRSTIYAWMEKDLFPRPVHLGPRAIGWLAGDIDQWVLSRRESAQRDSHTSALAVPRCRGE